jgi:hypothetical protein
LVGGAALLAVAGLVFHAAVSLALNAVFFGWAPSDQMRPPLSTFTGSIGAYLH